jgi:F-type H+-transporting ATPase subunit b
MQVPAGDVTPVDVPPSAGEVDHTTATVAHEAAHDAHPVMLGLDAEGWVYVSITIFFLLAIFVMKAPKLIAQGLDARIAQVKAQLAEAKTLREEAEKLLADAKAREAQGEKDAAAIIAHARQEAEQITAAAQKSAETMVARRTAMAEAKIGAAERAAEAELRARAATLATAAAARIIADTTDKTTKTKLTDAAISELDRRLH